MNKNKPFLGNYYLSSPTKEKATAYFVQVEAGYLQCFVSEVEEIFKFLEEKKWYTRGSHELAIVHWEEMKKEVIAQLNAYFFHYFDYSSFLPEQEKRFAPFLGSFKILNFSWKVETLKDCPEQIHPIKTYCVQVEKGVSWITATTPEEAVAFLKGKGWYSKDKFVLFPLSSEFWEYDPIYGQEYPLPNGDWERGLSLYGAGFEYLDYDEITEEWVTFFSKLI